MFLGGSTMKLTKEERNKQAERLKKKVEIIRKHRIEPKPFVYDILDEIWDDSGNLQADKIQETVDKIKLHRKQVKRENERIRKEAIKDIESFGLIPDKDYSIGFASVGMRGGKTEHYISLTFGLKGNKKIVDHFLTKGWVIDRRYKNEDGNPSIYSSDWHGKNMFFNVVMIVMKYVVEDLY